MEIIIVKRFRELTLEQLYGILRVRAEVFVTGQRCLYVDPDGKDVDAVHVFAIEADAIIGCLRIYRKEDGILQIGRVAVLERFRRHGVGERMMFEAIRYVRESCSEEKLYLEAQLHAIGFYEKSGFEVVSGEFLDEGIPHRGMELRIDRENRVEARKDCEHEKYDVEIRKASLDDLAVIRGIAMVAFPATYSSIIAQGQIAYMMEWMYSEDVLRRELSGNVTYLLLEISGKAVGYVSFGPEREEEHYHLHKLYLLPECQGMGYGKLLFEAAEESMRKLGAGMFELNVNRYNKALDFYLHMHMRIDRSGDFDIGDGYYMNDYVLRKYL